MIIQHNMAAINTMRQLGVITDNLKKSTERLSSGYRVNRAADNAAKLSISEKKRSQIRGLLRAEKNAEEGMDFIKTGDSAMGEIVNMLQRMRELTIQALNDVNTESDRAALQMEMDDLQSEIDRVNVQTEFNTLPVFEHYPETYYVVEGNRHWQQDQLQIIDDTNNSMTVKYQIKEGEPEKEFVLTVPNGEYTTQELIDEIDDIITAMGDAADGLCVEYTKEGTCNVVLKDGELIDEVKGGLAYLLFDEYVGAQVGAVIGTTSFENGGRLTISGENNNIEFTIENFDGTSDKVEIELTPGRYTREEIIAELNKHLGGTTIKASEYGDKCVQLGGEYGIVTGLKGDMFKIDDKEKGEKVYSSVFYDNTKYGSVEKVPAVFTGGTVLSTDSSDTAHNRYHIDGNNDKLYIRINEEEGAPYKEITLDHGDFTADEMVTILQEKIGPDVKVERIQDGVQTQNNNSIRFDGIQITTLEKGEGCRIDFDIDRSSAYSDLFCCREYLDKGRKVSSSSGYYYYDPPSITGGKKFDSSDFPMKIDSSNNSFRFSITEKTMEEPQTTSTNYYTIKLKEGTYNSLDEILAGFNEQFNGDNAQAGLKGKIQAVNDGNRIRIEPKPDNRTVTDYILLQNTSSSPYKAGYELLFVGEERIPKNTISASGTKPEVELPGFTFPMQVDEPNNKINLNVDGQPRPVTVPPGQYDTADKLLDAIRPQLGEKTTTTPKHYEGSDWGSETNNNQSKYDSGRTYSPTFPGPTHGKGDPQEGTTAGGEDAQPARYTVPVNLPPNYTVTSPNDQVTVMINGTNYSILVDPDSYTPTGLAQAIESKLNAKSKGADKVTVSVQGGKLHIETVDADATCSLAVPSQGNSLLTEMGTTREDATITIDTPLKDTINVESGSNQVIVTVNGNPQPVTVAPGNYSKSDFVEKLSEALKPVGAKAELTNGCLKLTTTGDLGGSGSIAFDTEHGGSCIQAMYGDLKVPHPAEAVVSPALQENIHLEDGSNQFSIQLSPGGSPTTVTIPPGDYDRNSLAGALNTAFGDAVSVKVDGAGRLVFTTAAEGNGAYVRVNSDLNSSAGTAMFGENTTTTPALEPSVDADGNLVLTGKPDGKNHEITVTPGGIVPPVYETIPIYPQRDPGSVSIGYYKMQSTAGLTDPTEVKDYSSDFSFTYVSPAGSKPVSLNMPIKSYSPEDLKKELQTQLDNKLGKDELIVSVTSQGLKIRAGKYGGGYGISNPQGGFYDYIICGTAIREMKKEPVNTEGKQLVSPAYIIGRKDVRNEICKIKPGVSDKLNIDVVINDVVHTLEMTLDPGEYDGDSLVNMIQGKLDDAVLKAGLPPDSIQVGIGKFITAVHGANDPNALDFYLNDSRDINLPEGEYRIEGLTGNSLFEIFYKTEGELEPAYTVGSKDITNGVVIPEGEGELSFDVDGVTYTYEIPEGSFSQDEILDIMNKILSQPDKTGQKAPVKASLSGDAIRLSLIPLGKHTINNVKGPAKDDLFYEMNGRKDYDSGLMLQIGANEGQAIRLERFSMSTLTLGINSITLSKAKYANKALVRLDKALSYVSEKRSIYGAKQNRLEYAVRGNANTAENLQASESRDRDADIASEAVQLAKDQILQQAATAMLSQSQQQARAVLDLLEGGRRNG